MKIADLSHLENASENDLIVGGASLAITANAFATGDDTYTDTITNIDFKTNGKVTKAKGTGTALAIGSDPYADVNADYEGFDKVKIKPKSRKGHNYAYETIKIIAMDRPNK